LTALDEGTQDEASEANAAPSFSFGTIGEPRVLVRLDRLEPPIVLVLVAEEKGDRVPDPVFSQVRPNSRQPAENPRRGGLEVDDPAAPEAAVLDLLLLEKLDRFAHGGIP
jgi:hypothetical protein